MQRMSDMLAFDDDPRRDAPADAGRGTAALLSSSGGRSMRQCIE
jgi:hypothetical protein